LRCMERLDANSRGHPLDRQPDLGAGGNLGPLV
jgi:hypothetical protein